ncbi:hypothetical protein BM92_17575 (plasmid) [Haloferax mediterranei ATCC 33500]|uniref:Uncharacterized protein n=1 Tax=Haloferax mediterranei (strain ATCC 33500 / DSM 1411 / JCM 8866 / NBRC 14739 / NCIMB 2177 / R-4) TaxID=523841 RepID=A0A059TZP4_HALMT|nr:hypothetical protein BM92_17575 [Haloferax mediterranei ATCC 33500]
MKFLPTRLETSRCGSPRCNGTPAFRPDSSTGSVVGSTWILRYRKVSEILPRRYRRSSVPIPMPSRSPRRNSSGTSMRIVTYGLGRSCATPTGVWSISVFRSSIPRSTVNALPTSNRSETSVRQKSPKTQR